MAQEGRKLHYLWLCYGILETVKSYLRQGLSHKYYRHCDISLQGHRNLFLKIEFCKNLSTRQVHRFVCKLQMAFVIHLPLWLLGYGTNKEIEVKTYRLFWNVARQQVETIVYCGCGLCNIGIFTSHLNG